MKFWIFIFCLLIIFDCPAQTNQTPPTPPTTTTLPTTTIPSATQPATRNNPVQLRQTAQTARESFDSFRNLDIPRTYSKDPLSIISEQIQPLYRKPSQKELKNLMPSQTLLSQNEQFLKQPNTGIFKLSADSSCAKNAVIVATENCLSTKIPSGGIAYSFRVNSHRILHLADLTLEKDVLKTDGIMQQGVMVNLGNLELEQISAETNGLKYLLDFKPATNKEEMQKLDQALSDGIQTDGFIYRFAFYADDKTTFALRSIAYRGKVSRSIGGVSYNEMDYDKRKDILVVFRIIDREANGDITILWKELARKDSPTLNLN